MFVAEGTAEWRARVAAGHKPGLVGNYGPGGAAGWLFADPVPERKNS